MFNSAVVSHCRPVWFCKCCCSDYLEQSPTSCPLMYHSHNIP